jgi:hypothetical protein
MPKLKDKPKHNPSETFASLRQAEARDKVEWAELARAAARGEQIPVDVIEYLSRRLDIEDGLETFAADADQYKHGLYYYRLHLEGKAKQDASEPDIPAEKEKAKRLEAEAAEIRRFIAAWNAAWTQVTGYKAQAREAAENKRIFPGGWDQLEEEVAGGGQK